MIRFLSKTPKKKLQGTVLLRLDFNTEDEWRMIAVLPTIRFLLKCAEKVVIVSHRGRPVFANSPAGRFLLANEKLSLRKDAWALSKFLKRKVIFIPHFRFDEIKEIVAGTPRGSVLALQNIRFLKGESTPQPELAKKLAGLADYYVNDAFAVAHHAADSVSRIERFLPSYAGLELEREIKFLSRVLTKPKKPLVVILGGGKAHDKLGVMKYFKDKADCFLLGGAAANTVACLRGFDVKKSLTDKDPKDLKELRAVLRYRNVVLPVDWRMEGGAILDIGPRSGKIFTQKIGKARTVIWSGPMGLFERRKFADGTLTVARAVAANRRAFSVAGGGETVAFLKKHRLDGRISFISTGGGAMLDFLAGKKLPGIAALENQK